MLGLINDLRDDRATIPAAAVGGQIRDDQNVNKQTGLKLAIRVATFRSLAPM